MHDAYLLLTPLLTLLVVALVGFVGCDQVLGLHRDPPGPPLNLRADRANGRIDLAWDPPEEGTVAFYEVKRGTASHDYNDLAEYPLVPPARTSYPDMDSIVNATEYFYTVSATMVGAADPGPDAEELQVPPWNAGLTSLVKPLMLFDERNNFSGWVGMRIRIGSAPLVVKTLGRMVATPSGGSHRMKIVDGATKADVPGTSVTLSLSGQEVGKFFHAPLAIAVTLNPDVEYYVISEEVNLGDQFYDSARTRVETTGAASSVYAVNGDGVATYTISTTIGSSYGPVDLEY